MRASGVHDAQQNGIALSQSSVVVDIFGGSERRIFQRVEHLHERRHHGVVLHALVVVIGLAQHRVNFEAQLFGIGTEGDGLRTVNCEADLQSTFHFDRVVPDTAHETVAAFHGRIVPLQGGFGRCGEHGVQARSVGTVFFNQVLWIDAVVFRLGHGAHAFVIDGGAFGQIAHGLFQTRANHFAVFCQNVLDILWPEIILAAFVGAPRINVVQHHALCEQLGEGFVHFDQAQIAHHFGPETRIEQVQNGMLNAANVLVHGHPVVSTFCHHLVGMGRVAIAHEVPRRINKGVHGVGLAAPRFAAYRTHHASMKAFVFVERIARSIGNAIKRQNHRQIFFRYGHRAVLIAMNDGDGCAPVALTADTPVTQTPSGFLLAQAFGNQVGGYSF